MDDEDEDPIDKAYNFRPLTHLIEIEEQILKENPNVIQRKYKPTNQIRRLIKHYNPRKL
jgi:hypothetical protein